MARRATRQVNVPLPHDLVDELNLAVSVLDTSQADVIGKALRCYLPKLPARVRKAMALLRQARDGKP